LQNTSCIWRLCYVFYLALQMCCIAKKLMFGVCAELRVLFGTADVLHVENLLYLALELKYLFCLALSMC